MRLYGTLVLVLGSYFLAVWFILHSDNPIQEAKSSASAVLSSPVALPAAPGHATPEVSYEPAPSL